MIPIGTIHKNNGNGNKNNGNGNTLLKTKVNKFQILKINSIAPTAAQTLSSNLPIIEIDSNNNREGEENPTNTNINSQQNTNDYNISKINSEQLNKTNNSNSNNSKVEVISNSKSNNSKVEVISNPKSVNSSVEVMELDSKPVVLNRSMVSSMMMNRIMDIKQNLVKSIKS